ncbi:MAG: carboxypeptidase-like regulatory domain-containing protein [Kofleriaceae bacterium]
MKYALVLLAACGAATPHGRPPEREQGSIVGLVRDRDTGDVIAKAKITVRVQGELAPVATVTDKHGAFGLAQLAAGNYSLTANFAGTAVDVSNIAVAPGGPTVVDVMFDLGKPDPVAVDFGDAKDSEIARYRSSRHETLIEGTINNRASKERIAGAVVTAIGPGTGPSVPTLQAVSDDQGRYRFENVPPGIYVVSAYYSITNRGQIEVRRSDIHVGASEGVIVPLWVETEH